MITFFSPNDRGDNKGRWYAGSHSHQHEMVDFKILGAKRRLHSKLTALDCRRADFDLFSYLLARVSWDKALNGRGAQESWLVFKNHLLQTHE